MQTIYYSNTRSSQLERIDQPRKGAWISLIAPSETELVQFADAFNLDADLLLDAIDPYEAPRVERDESNVYVYTRYCYPQGVEIATEPLLLIHTSDYFITIARHDASVLQRLIARVPSVITTQKTSTLMLLLAEINQSYRVQLNIVSRRILRFRAELKKGNISTQEFITIIELEEDLNEFLAALQPQATMLLALTSGKYFKLYESDQDVMTDLRLDVGELTEFTRSRLGALRNIRQVHDAIATNNLNQTFKRLTSVAIFLSVITVVAGLWGMNVPVPFADNTAGFWIVGGLSAVLVTLFVWLFGRKNWL